jgi:hypothetical protein
MEKVIDILIYLYKSYPNSNQLSYSRTMKLIYLIEWRYGILKFEKLTDIQWILTQYGPYYSNLINIMQDSSSFDIETKFEANNKQEIIIKFLNNKQNLPLKEHTMNVINFVIYHCSEMSWSELNNLVNSTYGIVNSNINEVINIEYLAKKYKNVIK